jgi:hypothetical protein
VLWLEPRTGPCWVVHYIDLDNPHMEPRFTTVTRVIAPVNWTPIDCYCPKHREPMTVELAPLLELAEAAERDGRRTRPWLVPVEPGRNDPATVWQRDLDAYDAVRDRYDP